MLSTTFKVSTTVRPLVWGRARLVSALRRRPLVQQLADILFYIFIVFFIVTPILLAYRLVNRDRNLLFKCRSSGINCFLKCSWNLLGVHQEGKRSLKESSRDIVFYWWVKSGCSGPNAYRYLTILWRPINPYLWWWVLSPIGYTHTYVSIIN